ncbi:hypothetical protein B6D29_00540 [Microgenomates bacterium UTCPR1]|nr:MAG: hypothetical protein B6D29_00540 [Microgenomates bacterium UTCPR1]
MLESYLVILAVAAFIFDDKGRILLVKKSLREKVDPGLWVVPGGKIEPGEHVIDGLKREVMEEVGVHIKDISWVNDNVFINNGYQYQAMHFACHLAKNQKIKLEKNLEDYVFISKKDFSKYDIPAGLKETIKILFHNDDG